MGKSTGLDPSLAVRRELAEIRKALLDPVRGPSSRDGTFQSAKVAARHQPDSMSPLTGLPMAPRSRSVGSNLPEDHAVRAWGASRIGGGRRRLPPVCGVPRRRCEENPLELCTVRWRATGSEISHLASGLDAAAGAYGSECGGKRPGPGRWEEKIHVPEVREPDGRSRHRRESVGRVSSASVEQKTLSNPPP